MAFPLDSYPILPLNTPSGFQNIYSPMNPTGEEENSLSTASPRAYVVSLLSSANWTIWKPEPPERELSEALVYTPVFWAPLCPAYHIWKSEEVSWKEENFDPLHTSFGKSAPAH